MQGCAGEAHRDQPVQRTVARSGFINQIRLVAEAVIPSRGWSRARRAIWLTDALRSAGPPLLFGWRLWVSVCLALYVSFWLELDNPFWAGYAAATVSQPNLGA